MIRRPVCFLFVLFLPRRDEFPDHGVHRGEGHALSRPQQHSCGDGGPQPLGGGGGRQEGEERPEENASLVCLFNACERLDRRGLECVYEGSASAYLEDAGAAKAV
jgi:hypothetical protein